MELSDKEVDLVRRLISDWGTDCPELSMSEIQPLAEKLGVWEPEVPPTPEEIKRREEFMKSPAGLAIAELFDRSNRQFAEDEAEKLMTKNYLSGVQWGEIGSDVKVRLPLGWLVTNGSKS
jgi:hypothetical protein